jgi:hypothetical protein
VDGELLDEEGPHAALLEPARVDPVVVAGGLEGALGVADDFSVHLVDELLYPLRGVHLQEAALGAGALVLDRLAVDVPEDELEELPGAVEVPAVDAPHAHLEAILLLAPGGGLRRTHGPSPSRLARTMGGEPRSTSHCPPFMTSYRGFSTGGSRSSGHTTCRGCGESMDIARFWQLVESSRRGLNPNNAEGNMERQRGALRALLLKLPPEEVLAFRNHLFELMNVAFRWELWGAAYLIAGGCSDDGFADFRGWLISMGRRVFEDALVDAESLLGPADVPGVEEVFFEELPAVPARVYEELTRRELPAYDGHHPPTPAGEPWSEEGGDLERRFPRLWARYGER